MHANDKIQAMREQLMPVIEDMFYECERTKEVLDDYEERIRKMLPYGCQLKKLNRKTLKVTVVVDYKLVEMLPIGVGLIVRVYAMA